MKEKRQEKLKAKTTEKLKVKSKKEKRAMYAIVTSVCLVAVLMASLSLLNVTTDVLKEDDDTVKTMALSSLSGQDVGELEVYLSKLFALSEVELSESTASDEFYKILKPQNKNGLYRSLIGEASLIGDEADPYERFKNENGIYEFYKVEAESVDEVLKSFGLLPNHTLNLKEAYYCGGSYYFSKGTKDKQKGNMQADVVSSKRIQDGSYYIECVFYYSEADEGKTEGKIYAIVKKEQNEDGSANKWVFKKISKTPLFDASGIMTQSESSIKYEMQRESFEGLLPDGTVFCEYTIEYPVFKGESLGENAANMLYKEMLLKYKNSADEAERYFKESELKKSDLPLAVHISSEVTFGDEKYISTIVDISEYNPSNSEEGEEDKEKPVCPARVVEGYIFDTESGEYVSKDAVIGKDYRLISDLLYRIQGGYEYEDLLNEEVDRPSYIPPDDKIGKSFYESGGAITKNGYVFCLVTEEGYVKSAVLPNEVIKRINK